MTCALPTQLRPLWLLGAAMLLPLLAAAQTPAQPSAAVLKPLPPVLAGAADGRETAAEPQVLRQVAEDDHVRIEELRVRGLTQKITVQPKIPGMPAYEIVPPSPGKAPGQDPKAGQRVWLSVPLSF